MRFLVRAYRHRWSRRVRIGLAVTLVSLGSAVIGVMLFAQTHIEVGPFRAKLSVSPSVRGGTEVAIPPLAANLEDFRAVALP